MDAILEELFPTPESFFPIQDVVYEVNHLHYSEDDVKRLFRSLPKDLQCDALQWGVSDTVFRDELYTYLSGLK